MTRRSDKEEGQGGVRRIKEENLTPRPTDHVDLDSGIFDLSESDRRRRGRRRRRKRRKKRRRKRRQGEGK